MDITKNYIDKCSKAKQLQDLIKKMKYGQVIAIIDKTKFDYNQKEIIYCGDQVWTIINEPSKNIAYYEIYDGYDGSQMFFRDNFIWLPRIDELIDHIKTEWQDNLTYVEIIQEFNDWFTPLNYTDVCGYSPEELWLDFVMFRLYGKKCELDTEGEYEWR